MIPSFDEIQKITKESVAFDKFTAHYETNGYFDVILSEGKGRFGFELNKVNFIDPVAKSFDFELFPPYFENAEAVGVFKNDHLIAILETNHELWNNRLRVTELWVLEKYRHQGYGGLLLEYAKNLGREKNCRGLVLETQSCNIPAISLYLKYGFSLIGLDTTCYSPNDIEKKEVRLEMGLTL
jgi:ribosomal protein S18 acetylase RimI-like enzyme